MAQPNDSILVTPGSGATVATQSVGGKEYQGGSPGSVTYFPAPRPRKPRPRLIPPTITAASLYEADDGWHLDADVSFTEADFDLLLMLELV